MQALGVRRVHRCLHTDLDFAEVDERPGKGGGGLRQGCQERPGVTLVVRGVVLFR